MLELFLFIAALIEQFVELTFGRLLGDGKLYPQGAKWLPFISVGVGILVCVGFKVGAIAGAMSAFGGGDAVTVVPLYDYIATGVLLSAGADAFHAFRTKYLPGGGR